MIAEDASSRLTRRAFLAAGTALGAAALLPGWAAGLPSDEAMPPLCIFSKHLHFLGYEAMAEAARELGFDSVDLTLRPGGHVEPARAAEDLPRAAAALRAAGMQPIMLTTALSEASEAARRLLSAAAAEGFSLYRSGWLAYEEAYPMPEALARCRAQLRGLAALGAECGMRGAYQNHSGPYFGAAVWDLWDLLKDLPAGTLGCQYDLRHASVEGAQAWFHNLRLIAPYVNSLTIKDYIWKRGPQGWRLTNVPLGQGMADYPRFFRFLRQAGIRVPMSLHFEYPLGGAEAGAQKLSLPARAVFGAMRRDLDALRRLWAEAGR